MGQPLLFQQLTTNILQYFGSERTTIYDACATM